MRRLSSNRSRAFVRRCGAVHRWLIVSAIVSGAALAIGLAVLRGPSPATRPWTRPRPGTAVGSRVCAECHAEIVAAYFGTHSMSRSMRHVSEAEPIEDETHAEFSPPGSRVYRVERRDGEWLHHEVLLDRSRQPIHDHAERIAWVLGSGRRGRGYLVERDGMLFESPISWYSQSRTWNLSPGYDPAHHPRFDRKTEQACLTCHAGQVSVADPACDRLGTPPFVETGIGCERCHGPGGEHVARQRQSQTRSPDDSIVNPARLGPLERDSVCYQCHLRAEQVVLRPGRRPGDFRPGDRYDDVWIAFVKDGPTLVGTTTLVEQLHASRCFVESEGRLGCTSCHAPHSRPSDAERAGFYRRRCLQCHAERSCTAPLARQSAAPANGSCVHCHMPPLTTADVPHTALTDHRLLREPARFPIRPDAGPAPSGGLRCFAGAETRVPPRELERARGIVLASQIGSDRPDLLAQARQLLHPGADDERSILEQHADDLEVLTLLGTVYARTQRPDLALACWRRVVEAEPTNERALMLLTLFFLRSPDVTPGRDFAERLVKVNPHLPSHHWMLARLQERMGRIDESIAAAERTLQLDPTAQEVRRWLVRAYDRRQQPEQRAAHEDILKRMESP